MAEPIDLKSAGEGIEILNQLAEASKAAAENLALLTEGAAAFNEAGAAMVEGLAAQTEALTGFGEADAEVSGQMLENLTALTDAHTAFSDQVVANLETLTTSTADNAAAQIASLTQLKDADLNLLAQRAAGLASFKDISKAQTDELIAKGAEFVQKNAEGLGAQLANAQTFTQDTAADLVNRLASFQNFDVSKITSAEGAEAALDAVQQLAGSKSKAARAAAKAATIAEIGIDTGKSAIAAFRALVGTPFIGPILGAAAAATAVAFGAQQIAKVSGISVAGGGLIHGPGSGTGDAVPAMLSDGEFVVRADAARRVGVGRLQFINQTGRLPGFQEGGFTGDALSAAGGPTVNVTINALDSRDVEDFVRNRLGPILEEAVRNRTLNLARS